LLAHHYSEAGDKERAAAYWYQAGLQANARFATREAVAHFTKGIGLLASLPEGDTRDKRELEFQLAFALDSVAWVRLGAGRGLCN
jgi:predicted ATPase